MKCIALINMDAQPGQVRSLYAVSFSNAFRYRRGHGPKGGIPLGPKHLLEPGKNLGRLRLVNRILYNQIRPTWRNLASNSGDGLVHFATALQKKMKC